MLMAYSFWDWGRDEGIIRDILISPNQPRLADHTVCTYGFTFAGGTHNMPSSMSKLVQATAGNQLR